MMDAAELKNHVYDGKPFQERQMGTGELARAPKASCFTRFVELQAAWSKRFAEIIADAQERVADEPGEDEEDPEAVKDDMIINP